jgi:hypothetical protein
MRDGDYLAGGGSSEYCAVDLRFLPGSGDDDHFEPVYGSLREEMADGSGDGGVIANHEQNRGEAYVGAAPGCFDRGHGPL